MTFFESLRVYATHASLPLYPVVEVQCEQITIEPPCICGSTKPLDHSYADEGYGWPFCPDCKAV